MVAAELLAHALADAGHHFRGELRIVLFCRWGQVGRGSSRGRVEWVGVKWGSILEPKPQPPLNPDVPPPSC